MSILKRAIWLFRLGLVTTVLFLAITPISAQSTELEATTQEINQTAANYPPDPVQDITWPAGFVAWSDVVAAFNLARMAENLMLDLTLPLMEFPTEAAWDMMSDGDKVLWLINAERKARGLAPLQGQEAHATAVAQGYAEWLLAHNAFAHDADGRSPWERLAADARIGACHDFLGIAENLYFTATTADTPHRFVVEEAVYRMLYADAGSAWGHRHAMLWSAYTENSGDADREGFLGVGHARGGFTYGGVYYQNTNLVVMNFFDPCATWDGPDAVTPAPTQTPLPSPTATPTPHPTTIPEPSPSPTPPVEPTPLPDEVTRTVSGQVLAARDGAVQTEGLATAAGGIAGVTVTCETGMSTVTGADGHFTLAGLSPGPHTLTFSKPGYTFTPATMPIDLSHGDLTNIAIDGEPGPAGTELTHALHLPVIITDH